MAHQAIPVPHPLARLDGKRKYIFSIHDEEFYLHVITSRKEMEKYPEAARLISPTAFRTQKFLNDDLHKRGLHLKVDPVAPSEEVMEYWVHEGLPSKFEREDNQTVFVVENDAGKVVCAIQITINDLALRKNLGVSAATLVYLDTVMTDEDYRKHSIFSSSFDNIITLLGNEEKYGLKRPLAFCISMRASTVIDTAGVETNHMANLDRYIRIWNNRYKESGETYLQDRWCYGSGPGLAGGLHNTDMFYDETGVFKEDVVSAMIAQQMEKASSEVPSIPNPDPAGAPKEFTGIGSFLVGITCASHAELVEQRRRLMEARQVRGVEIHRDPIKGCSSWYMHLGKEPLKNITVRREGDSVVPLVEKSRSPEK